MSSHTYEAIAFLQDDSDFDLDVAVRRLAEWFPAKRIARDGKTITVDDPDWAVSFQLMDESFVAEESMEIAETFSSCSRSQDIANCKRRIEVYSTDPDLDMMHFNDFVLSCQTLETFRGVILFDPQSGELI
ncbi:MAG: hypothetical protein LC104_02490 [Bacteroidales bacterium]|nr:hypothetical protein [Bacteroidales bacterium]